MAPLDDSDDTPVDPRALTVHARLQRIEQLQRRVLRAHRMTLESLWRIEMLLGQHPTPTPWYVRLWRLLRRKNADSARSDQAR